ncbi:MATE family efflux transporter [Bradyrhizobium sp. USDA 4529]|nr:hypothetical protein [Bradyrhizobium elkanii]
MELYHRRVERQRDHQQRLVFDEERLSFFDASFFMIDAIQSIAAGGIKDTHVSLLFDGISY